MKILMLVNWKVEYSAGKPLDKQPPDYYVENELYWFYRYFNKPPKVDVVDVSSFQFLENFEKNKLRFYIWQTLKVLPKLKEYDLIVSHGMQSGVLLSLWRRIFKTEAKHIVFDIGSFNSAAESGMALKLMQFASKSIDYIIYHTSSQIEYYEKFFPWIVPKSKFIRFGTDLEFFNFENLMVSNDKDDYMVCVGYSKRDWDTLVKAYTELNLNIKLRLIGHVEEKYNEIPGIEQIPFVPIKELMNQIYNARFSILPLESFNYSYGQMTLMQQMALEKCVITAEVPSLLDYVEDEKTAILYCPKDVNDLKEKIQLAISNELLREDIGKRARRFLEKECNEKIMAKQIEDIFNECLK